ncbi:hypothetical protein SAMN05216570_3822 [Dyella sp. OK004]|nr:hypothetical protein SAMN05216570_3822 [Dyella sp. OK004]
MWQRSYDAKSAIERAPMKFIPSILLLAACLLSAGCAPAYMRVAPSVSGVVVNATDGTPVTGADVYLSEFPSRGTKSGPDGHYTIPVIRRWVLWTAGDLVHERKPGYLIVADAPGYFQGQKTWDMGDVAPQTIKMSRKAGGH